MELVTLQQKLRTFEIVICGALDMLCIFHSMKGGEVAFSVPFYIMYLSRIQSL